MSPDSAAGFLCFLALVAPGLVFQLTIERRLPGRAESAFREASRIALTSLVFSSIGILALLVVYGAAPGLVPDLARLVTDGWDYTALHLSSVFISAALIVAFACLAAHFSARFNTRRSSAELSSVSVWFATFRADRPEGTSAWIHVALVDGTQFWGRLRHYTEAASEEARSLTLGGANLMWQTPSMTTRERFGDQFESVVVDAERINYARVVFRDAQGNLRGGVTKESPRGREVRNAGPRDDAGSSNDPARTTKR